MENGLIYGYILQLTAVMKGYYKQSYLKVLMDKVLRSFERARNRSLIVGFFTRESRMDKLWRESRFYSVVVFPMRAIWSFARKRWDTIQRTLSQSTILYGTNHLFNNLLNYSLRSYGAFFFMLFTVEAALWVALQANELKYIIIRTGLIGISLVMMLIDVSVGSLLKNSIVFRFVENAFVDKSREYDMSKGKQTKKLAILMALGVAAGVLAYMLSIKIFLMVFIGAIAALIVLWKYEIGAFAAAGFAAIMPSTPLFALIGLTLVSFVCRWMAGSLPRYKATLLDSLVVMFFLVLCYSTLTSYYIKDSIGVLAIHSLLLAFYFVLTRTINSRYRLYLLVTLLILSAALTSMYGLYQYYTGDVSADAWIDKTMFEDIQTRIGSTFNNPNVLGEYLIMIIPLALGVLWYRKKAIYNIAFLGMLAIMIVCMILTFSRGAWLGLMLAMAGFFVIRDKRLIALCLIVLLIMPFALPESVVNRFTSIGNLQDTSSSYRLSIWMGSLRMAQDYWLSGIGLGSQAFKAIYPRYSLAAAYAHHSHNVYIQVILEMGAAGALLFALIILIFSRAMLAHQAKTKDKFLSSIMIAASTGIAGYLVQGLVEHIWYNNRVLHTFWVVLAVGVCALRQQKEEVRAND